MEWELPELGTPVAPHEFHRPIPFEPAATSERLGWVGLGAVRFDDIPDSEFDLPSSTHHTVILFTAPPDEMHVSYEGVKRHRPAPVGAISVMPAGLTSRWCWIGRKSSLHVLLDPAVVERVAAEAFGLDPAREAVSPLDCLDLPQLRAAMLAVNTELTSGGVGGSLAAESLANVLTIHLLRHIVGPKRPAHGRDGTLPRHRLRAVVDYIEEHLDAGPSLAEMAAEARLNPYHFARQFRAATGLPPHQYVIMRRVERAKGLLRTGTDMSLAEVALRAGFYDQSQFSRHFKRLVGVTPGQFQTPSRIA